MDWLLGMRHSCIFTYRELCAEIRKTNKKLRTICDLLDINLYELAKSETPPVDREKVEKFHAIRDILGIDMNELAKKRDLAKTPWIGTMQHPT